MKRSEQKRAGEKSRLWSESFSGSMATKKERDGRHSWIKGSRRALDEARHRLREKSMNVA